MTPHPNITALRKHPKAASIQIPTCQHNQGMCEGNTLPETNSSHLKMDDWKTSFLLGWPIFRCELLVSGRVVTSLMDATFGSLLRYS